jgi:hypothetical protein
MSTHLRALLSRCVIRVRLYIMCNIMNFSSQVFTGKIPFSDVKRDWEAMEQVEKGLRPKRPGIDSRFPMPDRIWNIVEFCWHQQPSKRPNFETVMKRLKAGGPSS